VAGVVDSVALAQGMIKEITGRIPISLLKARERKWDRRWVTQQASGTCSGGDGFIEHQFVTLSHYVD